MPALAALMDTTTWDENPLEFPESITTSLKMTRVRTQRTFSGALAGHGLAFYNMVYHPNDSGDTHAGTATFNGLMYFSGEIEGKGKGGIVFKSTGNYGKQGAICEWESDPNTGTDDLVGLKATGGYKALGMKGSEVSLEIKA